MAEINEYAKSQKWACKEAIIRIFKYDPFTSGRLYTEYQNLPARTHKIRQNTLINGEPIKEVDFNANDLRLFLAFNKLDVYGDGNDAYREIANLAKVDRTTVKSFFTAALHCESYERARSGAKVPDKFGRRIMEAFERLYPKVQLFSGKQPLDLLGRSWRAKSCRLRWANCDSSISLLCQFMTRLLSLRKLRACQDRHGRRLATRCIHSTPMQNHSQANTADEYPSWLDVCAETSGPRFQPQ